MNTPANILFKFATRSRPEKFFAAIHNIREMVSGHKNYHILVSIDDDDQAMAMIPLSIQEDNHITISKESSKNKIAAINRDMNYAKNQNWDILINMSDDMAFTVKWFDDIIRADMEMCFPDGDGMLHYNDGFQKDNVVTMSIMGRKYYERFGYIYHPDYESVWADVEATEVAHMLGKLCYNGDEKVIFNHNHPAWGRCESDEQYKKTEDKDVHDRDKAVILRRRALDYGLDAKDIVAGHKYPQNVFL